jgi:hypothetical protein
LLLGLLLLAGCGPYHQLWHDVVLPSGATVKVTSFYLVWGIDDDIRKPSEDCLALEFVTNIHTDDAAASERELSEVFELIRPASESWGFKTASIARFPMIERKGHYDLFAYKRAADGKWTYEHSDRKVFSTD